MDLLPSVFFVALISDICLLGAILGPADGELCLVTLES